MWQPGWEGGFGGEWIHVYVQLGALTVSLKVSQHCYSAISQYKIKSPKEANKYLYISGKGNEINETGKTEEQESSFLLTLHMAFTKSIYYLHNILIVKCTWGKKNKLAHRPFLGGNRKDGGTSREQGLWVSFPEAPQLPRDTAGSLLAHRRGGPGGDQQPSAHRKAACPPNC